jgi:tetratricopeptide (TPR) repeat protein
LARQAQVEVERDAQNKWKRWHTCRQCEQMYHGVVSCAFGWACWKTYVGRPERDWARVSAMTRLGNGLSAACHNEDALSVREGTLSMLRRIGGSENDILATQNNLANTYHALGQLDRALQLERDVYSGYLRLNGEEHVDSLMAALNYAKSLKNLERFKEAKSLLRRTLPVARRVLGENYHITLRMRWAYAKALYRDADATLDDLCEAVTTLEDTERIARQVFGGAHPITEGIEENLQRARAALRDREGDVDALREAVAEALRVKNDSS